MGHHALPVADATPRPLAVVYRTPESLFPDPRNARTHPKRQIDQIVASIVVSYSFPLTQTHLADATGLTPVHVNRTLKALAADGLVTVSDRMVRILDWEALAEAGEFDPEYLQMNLQPEERLRIVD